MMKIRVYSIFLAAVIVLAMFTLSCNRVETFENLGTNYGDPIGAKNGYVLPAGNNGVDNDGKVYYAGVLEVKNQDAAGNTVGPTLTYHSESGVAILRGTSSGLFFKDMNGNGMLDKYEDWRLSTQERADDLASKMTSEKRLMLMIHSVGTTEAELKDGRRFRWGTSIRGVTPEVIAEQNNRLQLWAEKDLEGFGIPVVTPSDPRHTGTVDTGNPDWDGVGSGLSGWPNHIGLASTFDEEAIYNYSRITAREYRAIGLQMQIAPMVDLITDPRWSRAGGCFSEDPLLNENLNRAQIRAIQTSDEAIPGWGIDEGWGMTSVASMAKHWPGGGNGEFGFDAHHDDGKFGVYPNADFENYMYTHARAAGFLKEDKGTTQQSAAFMPYFTITLDKDPSGLNVGNGLSHYMIQQLLRDRYEYDGFGVTDWNIHASNGRGYEDKKGYTTTFRGLEIFKVGMDQIGGVFNTNNSTSLLNDIYAAGLEQLGQEEMEKITYRSAVRCLRIMINLGLFESAYTDPQFARDYVGSRLLQETAQKDGHNASTVMIKNKGNLLPRTQSGAPGTPRNTVFIPQKEDGTAVMDLTIVQRYYDVPNEIIRAVAAKRKLTPGEVASAAAKSDFAIIKLLTPTPGHTGIPAQNLKYSPYTAQWQREISLGWEWVHADDTTYVRIGDGEVPNILAGDHKSNRSTRNGLTHNGIASSLNIINNTVAAMGNKPIVFALDMTNPMVVSDFEPYCDAIIVGGRTSDISNLEIISGAVEPNGLLTVNFPMNMETVELAFEDTPHDMIPYIDSEGNRYTFGFGLNWEGIISDARTSAYVTERNYPLSEKRGLVDYIQRAEKLNPNYYNSETNRNLSTALSAAKSVNADRNATQDKVNEAAEALRKIIRSLPQIHIEVLSTPANAIAGNIRVRATAETFTPKNPIIVKLTDKNNKQLAVVAADENGNATLTTDGLEPGVYTITAISGSPSASGFAGTAQVIAALE
ncbi:hypothetical protein LJC43_04325 [Parabacteroides sp. OttesenSCG-928-G21]|nr:hypothetical protein [Parabacteroides sp. OttesenSCG-928-G21]